MARQRVMADVPVALLRRIQHTLDKREAQAFRELDEAFDEDNYEHSEMERLVARGHVRAVQLG